MGEITNRLGTKINKQPISTKQFVALFVHTKSTIQQTFKNKHAEKSNMGKNSKSNEKHTWIALVAIALFLFPLFFTPQKSSESSFACPLSFILFIFSHIYIIPQDLNLFSKKKILLFPFFFSSFPFFKIFPFKSDLPHFEFPSKTFR